MINSVYSYVTDTPDFWRRARQKYPAHGQRFTGEPAYFKHITSGCNRYDGSQRYRTRRLQSRDLPPAQHQVPTAVGKDAGFQQRADQTGLLAPVIGNTYAGAALVGLSAVLDMAEPATGSWWFRLARAPGRMHLLFR